MRKWLAIVLLVTLLSAMLLTGQAAQNSLKVDDVKIKPGETVYVKLELTQSTVGDAMGVMYSYDPSVLKPLKSSSTWARKGMLQDFDTKKGTGIWADSTASDRKGLVCTLAFAVVSKEEHFDTEVVCTLIVKNGTEEVGNYTAKADVSTICEHAYGKWQNASDLGHSRTCEICGRKQSQSHHWDDGITAEIPNRPGMEMTTYTCQDCGATKSFEHLSDNKPTAPVETLPPETEPEDRPTEPDASRPTRPDHNQGGSSGDSDQTPPTAPKEDDRPVFTIPDFNGEGNDVTFPWDNEEHNHPTVPGSDHDRGTAPTVGNDHNHGTLPPLDHDHDHGSETLLPVGGKNIKTSNVLIFLGAVVILSAVAVFVVKKKRK